MRDCFFADGSKLLWHTGFGKNISWQTPEGAPVKAILGEHTRVLIGFIGTKDNPKYLILLDPIYGKIIWPTNKFLQNWASIDNKAVVVY